MINSIDFQNLKAAIPLYNGGCEERRVLSIRRSKNRSIKDSLSGQGDPSLASFAKASVAEPPLKTTFII